MTPLHVAAASRNIVFLELVFEDLNKRPKAEVISILNIQEAKNKATCIGLALRTSVAMKE